jgi:hypothetical protein
MILRTLRRRGQSMTYSRTTGARLGPCARMFYRSAISTIGQWSLALRPSAPTTPSSFSDVQRSFVTVASANGWDT